MIIRISSLAVLIFIVNYLGTTPQTANPYFLGLACGGVASAENPWSGTTNPAVNPSRSTALMAGTSGVFSKGEISEAITLCSTPIAETYSVRVAFSGAEWGPWKEVDFSAGLAGRFGRIDAGLRCHAVGTTITEYGSAFVPRLDAGLLLPLDSSVRFGLALQNITGSTLADRPLPQKIGLGIAWRASGSSELLLDVDADPEAGSSISLGLVQNVIEPLELRAGLSTDPITVAFGCGLSLDHLRIDYGTSFRLESGLIHGFGGGYSW